MVVDAIASETHYMAHLAPIWYALPYERKGTMHFTSNYHQMDHARSDRLTLVGGWQDCAPLRNLTKMIYVEHGAGQAYGGDIKSAMQPGYSGSGGYRHTDVVGFICPSQTVADRWTTAPAVAVGCAKTDALIGYRPPMNTVCLAFHWPCEISPESTTAFYHYKEHLWAIRESFEKQNFTVFGHGHPRWEGKLDRVFAEAGFQVLGSDGEVFEKAHTLVMDNSSLQYEFAGLDRPVITLNAPWYRRNINHGLRFWDYVPGIQVDEPEELLALDLGEFLQDDPGLFLRRAAADHAYAFRDGSSTRRAVEFILSRLQVLESE